VTDGQTDRHLATAQSAMCTASRGKNCKSHVMQLKDQKSNNLEMITVQET